MNSDIMRRAISLSANALCADEGGPFGAVIARGDDIIAEGFNCVTSTNDPTAHAEVVAIRRACKKLATYKLHGCQIYTSCEPCPMCLAAIYWAHLDAVFYANTRADAAAIGFDDDLIYDELGLPLDDRRVTMAQSLRNEALCIFQQWQDKEDRIDY